MNMDRVATLTLACCFLHNFCEIYAEQVPFPKDIAQRPIPFVGVCGGAMRLSGDGKARNVARTTNFESWVAKNSNV